MRCTEHPGRLVPFLVGLAFIAGISLLGGSSGCLYMAKTKAQTWGAAAYEPRRNGEVLVQPGMEVAGRAFDVLGPVRVDRFSAWKHSISTSEIQKLTARLLGPAREMGADAVVGLHSGEYRDRMAGGSRVRFWVSGLAVHLLPPGELPTQARGNAIVALTLPYIAPDVTAPLGSELLEAVRSEATWRLEQKHYFVRECAFASMSADSLARMDDRDMDGAFGGRTELVLTSRIKEISMEKMTARALLEAELYSRSQKKVVWRDEAWGTCSKVLEGLLWSGYGAALRAQDARRSAGLEVGRPLLPGTPEQVADLVSSLDARGPGAFLSAVQKVLDRVPSAD
jgi:hypothetical protein